jgi:hypothetical protein
MRTVAGEVRGETGKLGNPHEKEEGIGNPSILGI